MEYAVFGQSRLKTLGVSSNSNALNISFVDGGRERERNMLFASKS